MGLFSKLDHEMELLKKAVKEHCDAWDYIMGVVDPSSVTGCCAKCNSPATKWTSYDHPGGWRVKGLKGLQWMYFDCPKCFYQTSWDHYKIPRGR